MLFEEMMSRIQANTVTKLFRVQIRREEEKVPELQQKERQMVERGAADKSDADETTEDGAEAAQSPAKASKRANRAAAAAAAAAAGRPIGAAAMGAEGDGKVEPVRRDRPKVGRNDPCPCGSGKKYKKCHGKEEAETAADSQE